MFQSRSGRSLFPTCFSGLDEPRTFDYSQSCLGAASTRARLADARADAHEGGKTWLCAWLALLLTRRRLSLGATYDKTIQTHLKQLIVDANTARMLHGSKRVPHDILNVQIDPYLVQDDAQVGRADVGQHDELHACGRLVVMQLVFAGAIGYESEKGGIPVSARRLEFVYHASSSLIIFASKPPHHVPQREDDTEEELGIVCLGTLRITAGSFGITVGGWIRDGSLRPPPLVDAFRYPDKVPQQRLRRATDDEGARGATYCDGRR